MNYTNTIRTLLFALAAVGLLGLTACDQTIDKDPEQSLPIDQVFQDVAGAQSALTGAYSGLQADGVYGGFQVMAGDFTADVANFSGSFTTWQQAAAFNISSTHGPTENIWDDHYDAINRANLIIENAPNLEGADQSQVDDLVGQAKFIRALSYFNLVRWFGEPYEPGASNDQPGVILQTDGVQSTDPDFNQPRASVGDIYGQIRTDLEDAISRLDVKAERIRAGQAVAEALLAKVSLYQGRYAEASDLAGTVIRRDDFTLSDDPTVPYANESNPEIIFSTSFSSIDNSGTNDFMSSFYLPQDFGGRGDINPVSSFVSGAEPGDIRAGTSPGTSGPEIKGDNLLYSYDGNVWSNKWTDPNFGDDMPVLRVAEMYLIRAEAEARGSSGSESQARQDVNAIRDRAGLGDVSSSLSGQALIDEIIQQRRYELAFEGDRRHDLQRLGRPIASSSATAQPGDSQRILPIPARAIEVNDALDQSSQNPGY
ncbi:RagB/SusD family nutrient uptake outer membrane protein [Salinibacter ruber]|jgi:hypothetical protein|uniref:RagB/SusD family nutrient uptake outer membrane protein n=1 Tax=Salinibacter ruber TaxID=146919 RepID=UPI002169F1DF|nr:RagB/SusD family nutrient uptake outer membrane protein [Salinibacter ruber]MCS3784568.1 hypothetical protein [Salinibacter ruber]